MKHLDEDLFRRAEAGDQGALEVKRAVGRLDRALEVLQAAGICPDCLLSHVAHSVDVPCSHDAA